MLSGLAHLPCAARNGLVYLFFLFVCFVYFLTLNTHTRLQFLHLKPCLVDTGLMLMLPTRLRYFSVSFSVEE